MPLKEVALSNVAAIKGNPEVVLPWYLAFAINSRFVAQQLLASTYNEGMLTLDINALEKVNLPLPRLERQNKLFRSILFDKSIPQTRKRK